MKRKDKTDPRDAVIAELKQENSELRADVKEQSKIISALEAHAPAPKEVDPLEALLGLEGPAREMARAWPSGPGSDAVKASLMNASHGIAHVRKSLETNASQHEVRVG